LKHKSTGEKRFDFHSINFRIWLYFVAFATCLLIALWGLQIFFLNTYYQDMKVKETDRVAGVIESQYKSENIIDVIRNLSYSNDMYIHIEDQEGTIVFSPITEEGRRPSYGYLNEMADIKEKLFESGGKAVRLIISEGKTDMNTLAYAGFVEDSNGNTAILYIFSPLYPVSSTVSILQEQLKYITVISLIIAFAISIYLARRISRPIRKITNQAKNLANGEYDMEFEKESYSEIANLAETLEHTARELAKSDRLQKDLIANVSHDIRTPLTMVKSYAELIRDVSGDDKVKREENLNVIIEEADRLNDLVTDMLTLSQIQSGMGLREVSEMNLLDTVESVVNPYISIMEKGGYNISIDIDETISFIADQMRIKQVITNLFGNAVKFSGEDKRIWIKGFKKDEYLRVEVIDKGLGIKEEELDKIWERYHQAEAGSNKNNGGTGLGLAIVKEIILLHKGKYGALSKEGEGSVFWFELPLTEA